MLCWDLVLINHCFIEHYLPEHDVQDSRGLDPYRDPKPGRLISFGAHGLNPDPPIP
jgi:hypothetical protein